MRHQTVHDSGGSPRRWLVLLALVHISAVYCQDDAWSDPYFTQPPDLDPGVIFDESSSKTIIYLNENLANVALVTINYAGDTVPSCSESFCNSIVIVQNGTDDNWMIYVSQSQDYESSTNYRRTAVITIGSVIQDITVLVVNLNDNDPVVQYLGEDICLIDENVVGESDCIIRVTDIDGGASLMTASVDYTVAAPEFELVARNVSSNDQEVDFVLTVIIALDYERVALRSTTIVAHDNYLKEERTGQVLQVVYVNDLPDEDPKWQSVTYTHSIDELTTWSFTYQAVDGDIAINADISYKLELENEGDKNYFSIDTSTGVFKIGEINRDELETDTYKMVVTAYETDDVTASVSANVTILVIDVNNNIPTISPDVSEIKIAEETTMTLELSLTCVDKDLGTNGQFEIELQENQWSKAFLLIPNAGYQTAALSISVVNQTALDYEDPDWRIIELKVIATEKADPTHIGVAEITVYLQDWNDESPIFEQELFNVEVRENVKIGDTITQVTATDADEGDVITYSLNQRVMAIDSSNGMVTVSASNAFDYERQQVVMVQVTAADEADHKAYAQISITVIDVNDEAPTLYLPAESLAIKEHTDEGFILSALINATDPDSDPDLRFSILWESTYATKQGVRLTNSALIREVLRIEGRQLDGEDWQAELAVNNADILDWEEFDTLYLSVAITDLNTDAEYQQNAQRSGILIISILDINDNAPEFTELTMNAKYSVEENSDPNRLIGNAVATDRDSEENGQISYRIEPLDGLVTGMVAINADTGEIRTGSNAKHIDCEEHQYQRYLVYASDGEFETNLTITIEIVDQNDENPTVIEGESVFYLYENTVEWNVTNINATDKDVSVPFHTCTYMYYSNNNNMLYFSITNDTGLVYVNLHGTAELDREVTPEYTLTFLVRDNFAEGITVGSLMSNVTTITVILLDENDNPPVFEDLADCTITAMEDHDITLPIYEGILATDADEEGNKNSEFTYTLESLEAITDRIKEDVSDLFKIETLSASEGTASIFATKSLSDLWGRYNLTLKATDHGDEPLSNYKSYVVCISDTNDNNPVITKPENGARFLISSNQEPNKQLVDLNQQPIDDFEATDDDDSSTGNGQVTFNITGSDDAIRYFRITSDPVRNTAQLMIRSPIPENIYTFEVTLVATDDGSPALSSDEVTIRVVRVLTKDYPPTFENTTQTLQFQENTTGLFDIIHEAIDLNNEGLTEDDDQYQNTLYTIREGNNDKFFELNHLTRNLSVIQELDYETKTSHNLIIQAYTFSIVAEPESGSLLHLLIEVLDINDEPPQFVKPQFFGFFSTTDKPNKTIITLEATDVDTNDYITYELVKDSIQVTDPSLEDFKTDALKMDGATIYLAFDPANRNLQGHFTFNVIARDSINPPDNYHMDTAEVQVHIISSANVIKFNFYNSLDEIKQEINTISLIFEDVLQYMCGIDNVAQATDSNGIPLSSQTVVDSHFIDPSNSQPLGKDVVVKKISDIEIYNKLRKQLLSRSLNLADYDVSSSSTQDNLQEYLQIVLICISSVLGVMVVVLFVAFFIRTRTLNKRLEKLSTTKFGSQDSGLNRVGIVVPNTNRHAVEGSNPVWNEEMHPEYDNMSQGSGDSDLIGIEDSPEFSPHGYGVDNAGFMPDPGRRASLNPLSNLAGDDPGAGPRRGSLHHLAYENSLPHDNIQNNNSNFSFRKPDSVPSTEL